MGMAMAEKILDKASKRDTVCPAEFVPAEVDAVMAHDRSFWAGHMPMTRNGFSRVRYPVVSQLAGAFRFKHTSGIVDHSGFKIDQR